MVFRAVRLRFIRARHLAAAYVGPPVPAQFAGAAGKQNISNPFLVLFDITTRKNLYLDASYVARIAGQQHTFKGGYAENRIANRVEDDYPDGRFDFYWGEDFDAETPEPVVFNRAARYLWILQVGRWRKAQSWRQQQQQGLFHPGSMAGTQSRNGKRWNSFRERVPAAI